MSRRVFIIKMNTSLNSQGIEGVLQVIDRGCSVVELIVLKKKKKQRKKEDYVNG